MMKSAAHGVASEARTSTERRHDEECSTQPRRQGASTEEETAQQRWERRRYTQAVGWDSDLILPPQQLRVSLQGAKPHLHLPLEVAAVGRILCPPPLSDDPHGTSTPSDVSSGRAWKASLSTVMRCADISITLRAARS